MTKQEKAAQPTPGPWYAEISRAQNNLIYIGPQVDEGIYLAEIWSDDCENDDPPTTTNWADARLMAAAPELLEALESMFDSFCVDENAETTMCMECGYTIGTGACETCSVTEKARAAIAKARGRQL